VTGELYEVANRFMRCYGGNRRQLRLQLGYGRIRPIWADGLRVIRSGLQGDETVIVEGAAKVRPNSKVSAEPVDMNKYATGQLAMETHISPLTSTGNPSASKPGRHEDRVAAVEANR
jgi:hypothetical protein